MPRDNSTKIVVCPETGDRLCYDNKWRSFAMFGSSPSCVKEYKYLGPALKAGARYRHPLNKGPFEAHVVHINEGDSMDAAGNVLRS